MPEALAAKRTPDISVIGAGLVGLSVAWRLAQRGARVTVHEAGTIGGGASHVAAGMLAPVAEAEVGEAGQRLLELSLRALAGWPAVARELLEATGVDVGLRFGSLLVARDADEAEALERELAFRTARGLAVERLRPSEARRREGALAPTLRLALDIPSDASVDPRRVVEALAAACRAAGVELREDARVEDPRALGGTVVLAAGAWSGELGGVPVRPVKGQLLRLRDPRGPGLVERVVHWGGASPGYLVPRADGAYVLGATMEERGFDTTVTAGGLYEILRDAHELVPGLSELAVEETLAGLRPATPDNVPIVEERDGLVIATGHGRNGVLLAPLTGDLVAEIVEAVHA